MVYSNTGDGIITIESKYTSTIKRVALYKWIEGKDFHGCETAEWFYKLGILTAKLHEGTNKLNIPKNLSPKSWKEVFYYNGEVGVYKEEKYQKFLNEEYHKVMDFIIPYLNERLPQYYQTGESQLIHADLNPWNIKIYKNELRLLDFEEAMLGYPIHDFAIMLFYYRYDQNFNCNDVKRDYFEGYNSIRALPEFDEYDLELLMTARRVNFLNYVLQIHENPSIIILYLVLKEMKL
ncbi:phosphotransferase enzyme family protein [Oceanirhabdus sp. W0125-5]|uniref:phosphotransferase enzyme family protein n=1 Tax=Oceanirhabdus sp. W0125-5 TaxID=2999116 RepID=UPI0022F2F8F5|nr:phosphotransferase [Oceanirhabdus sp. W0125-5]WBW95614.1 phosphotransferase [Oceanirhabdus sp. W0125-5]